MTHSPGFVRIIGYYIYIVNSVLCLKSTRRFYISWLDVNKGPKYT
jgi:hypothetical protein